MDKPRKKRIRKSTEPMAVYEMRRWDRTKWCDLKGFETLQIKVFGNRGKAGQGPSWYGVRIKGYHDTKHEACYYGDCKRVVEGLREVLTGESVRRRRGFEPTGVRGVYVGKSKWPKYPYGIQIGNEGIIAFEDLDESLSLLQPLVECLRKLTR